MPQPDSIKLWLTSVKLSLNSINLWLTSIKMLLNSIKR